MFFYFVFCLGFMVSQIAFSLEQEKKAEMISYIVNDVDSIQKEIFDAIQSKDDVRFRYLSSSVVAQDDFLDLYSDTMSYIARFNKIPPRHFFESQQETTLESLIEVLSSHIRRPFKGRSVSGEIIIYTQNLILGVISSRHPSGIRHFH